jgi:hypothetical protein
VRVDAGGGVGQHRGTDAAAGVDVQRRQEAGHRAVVADEPPTGVDAEHQAEAVVGRDRSLHLLQRRRGQHVGAGAAEQLPPRDEVGEGGPQLAGGRHRAGVGERFVHADPGEVVDAPAGLRAGAREVRRGAHVERLEQALGDEHAPGGAEATRDHLPQQGVAEVGVVEPLPRAGHPPAAVVGRDQAREVAAAGALPPVAARLALHARRVRERVADGHLAVADVAEVRRERVVEVEQPGVTGLHDQDGGHRLGDGADAVLPVEPGRVPRTAGPHRAVAVEDRGDDGRQPALGLGDVQQSLPLDAHPADPTT